MIPGYFKRPDLTAKAFDAEGYFNTGDLFQLKDNECIGFFERSKDIIIRGGFNVSAQEVENMVLGHPKVLDAAAGRCPTRSSGADLRLCGSQAGETVTLEEVVAFMKDKGLAVYKIPERLEIIEAIPRNPVGKILKKVLREDIKKKMGTP